MAHAHGIATIVDTDDSRSIPLDTRSIEQYQYGGELEQSAFATPRSNASSFSKEVSDDGNLYTSAAAALQKILDSREPKVLHARCLNRVMFSLILFFVIRINFDLSRHFLHVYDEGQGTATGTGTGMTRNAQRTEIKTRNGIVYDRVQGLKSTTSNGNNDLLLFDIGRVNVINDIGVGEWIMDTWIPPKPWKLFSPSEIQSIFSNHSVLWIGDSTARRAATTLYGILNSTMDIDQDGRIINMEDNMFKSSSSSAFIDEAGKGIGRYTPQYAIDGARIIDVNKHRTTEPCKKYRHLNICRPMPISPKKREGAVVRVDENTTTMTETAKTVVTQKEFGLYKILCMVEIERFAQNELNNKTHYTDIFDLIVIAIGAWEGLHPDVCHRGADRTTLDRYEAAFNALEQLASTKRHVTFVVRSSGFNKQEKGSDKIYFFNKFLEERIFNYTKLWYKNVSPHDPSYNAEELTSQNEGRASSFSSFFGVRTNKNEKDHASPAIMRRIQPLSNILFVDWAKVIAIRSFGKLRIDGDHIAHYGVGARLSLIQMITNTLAFQ